MTSQQFLRKYGQTSEQVDLKQTMEIFADKMKLGLREQCPTIPMIPTYLQNIDRSKIKVNVKRILIDAGGTNFRTAIGYFDEQGVPHIEDVHKTSMPASDGTYYSKERFYSTIANNVSNYLSRAKDIGFCFSYQVAMDKDVDGEVVMFSKEINAPEVIGTRVGRETLLACKCYGDEERNIVILNDTVATLLGGMATSNKKYSAYLGYIYGTGTNVCYIEDAANITKVSDLPSGKMLVNTECGNFDGFVQGAFDRECIAATAVPNRQQFEKMTSGKYLSNIIARAYTQASIDGEFEGRFEFNEFELKDVSVFLEGGAFPCKFANERDAQFAKDIAAELIDRAAKMGAIVNSALAIASCGDKSLPVAIVAEGTTFNKLTNYRAAFEKYLASILGEQGISYEIVQGEGLNLIGTLMATMIF